MKENQRNKELSISEKEADSINEKINGARNKTLYNHYYIMTDEAIKEFKDRYTVRKNWVWKEINRVCQEDKNIVVTIQHNEFKFECGIGWLIEVNIPSAIRTAYIHGLTIIQNSDEKVYVNNELSDLSYDELIKRLS